VSAPRMSLSEIVSSHCPSSGLVVRREGAVIQQPAREDLQNPLNHTGALCKLLISLAASFGERGFAEGP
jgi:hypothetical protein